MSDTQQGPDWWLGADGKWYPPMAPAPPPPDASDVGTPDETDSASVETYERKTRRITIIALAVLAVLVLIIAGVGAWAFFGRNTTKTATVTGNFSLYDTDGFRTGASGCSGTGGYGDINASTAVVLKDDHGNEVARTSLGTGSKSGSFTCTYTFELDVTQGPKYYVLSVGHRGESQYTWDEITTPDAINLQLGH